ncbi:hypothetical protein GCM10010232_43370 [Streptomyces amakusaensis]
MTLPGFTLARPGRSADRLFPQLGTRCENQCLDSCYDQCAELPLYEAPECYRNCASSCRKACGPWQTDPPPL